MTNNLMGWHKYRGKIIPRNLIREVTENYRAYTTRLRLGEHVRLRVDDLEVTEFLNAIVVDVSQSHRFGNVYALAFPMTPSGEFYMVTEGFSGAGMTIGTNLSEMENAELSGIYTEAEYEQYLEEKALASGRPRSPLFHLVVTAVEQDRDGKGTTSVLRSG